MTFWRRYQWFNLGVGVVGSIIIGTALNSTWLSVGVWFTLCCVKAPWFNE